MPKNAEWRREPSPKCECGAIVGLWFSERLGKYICPVCLDKEAATSPSWRREPPDAAGAYLACSAAQGITLEAVFKLQEILVVAWAQGSEVKMIPVSDPRLRDCWWFRIPEPPGEPFVAEPE